MILILSPDSNARDWVVKQAGDPTLSSFVCETARFGGVLIAPRLSRV
jgi:hypothetical protein